MNIHGSGVLDWRKLDLKQNIHYCGEREEPNVFKKRDCWHHNEEGNVIDDCPYCGVNLEQWEIEQEETN